ncbi:MAG: DoxX family membrane protein [Bacteroidales bacterium]|nr:DoxX family membrane protein [Bacteroidales bacterium]
MASNGRLILSWALRIALSAVFVASAVSKLMGIDRFELYVFSYGFFPLDACFLLARLCIGAELVVAAFTLCGWFPRTMRLVTLGMLLFFSLFLCYAALIGRNESCQCFGQWVHMNPVQSLLKNAVLIALTLLHYRLLPARRRAPRLWLAALLGVGLMVVPFVVSVPDNWLYGAERQPYDKDILQEALEPDGALAQRGLGEGHKLLVFVTQGCPYCKMAREKLTTIADRHHIDSQDIVYVLPSELPDNLFVRITYGSRPLLLLLDGREVVSTYHFRNIRERELARHLGR